MRCTIPAFTLIETMMVITIITILFLALEPAYDAFRIRSQLENATDRTRQILERAKTLAISGYRTRGAQPDLFIVEISRNNDPENRIRLCSQKFDPAKKIQPGDLQTCAPDKVIDSLPLGQVNITNPMTSTFIGFLPPFGASVSATSPVEVNLRIGDTAAANKNALIRFIPTTNRVEVNPKPTP